LIKLSELFSPGLMGGDLEEEVFYSDIAEIDPDTGQLSITELFLTTSQYVHAPMLK
jgi:hypothetical protein